jgi:indole-3-glycerol phosphate synthase
MKTTTILDEIRLHKLEEVAAAKRVRPVHELRERIPTLKPPRKFRDALRAPGISLIAEVKRASPTKGDMLKDVDALNLATTYEHAGARAISVLTDEKYFKGTLQDLVSVRQYVAVPCLRKEFIVDEYQIYEARAAEADAILLIVRILSDEQMREYIAIAERLGMGVLVETHDAEEIERAINVGAHIIGINNRDLSTFAVDINTTLELKKLVPGGKVLVSESGIHTRDDVRRLEDGGVDAVLIGEALVTSDDIGAKIRQLLGPDES